MLKIHYDGKDQVGIETSAINEREFINAMSRALADIIKRGPFMKIKFAGDEPWYAEFNEILPKFFEIVAAYKNYKTIGVKERRLLSIGDTVFSDDDVIAAYGKESIEAEKVDRL